MNKTLIFAILLSPLPAQDAATALQHAREVNLERAAKLPNFVADETVIRYRSRHTNPPKWEFVDKIELEINFRGSGTTRQNVRRNGKPWNKANFPPFNWIKQFGYELKPLFSTKCPTEIEFEGREEVRGKQLLAYQYHAPPDNCFGSLGSFSGLRVKNYNPARTGRFLVDDSGGNLVYFEGAASEFPKGFGMDTWKQTTSWDYIQIGDSSHLLPVAAEVFGGSTEGDLWHVVVEYKNHRHFETSSNLTLNWATNYLTHLTSRRILEVWKTSTSAITVV